MLTSAPFRRLSFVPLAMALLVALCCALPAAPLLAAEPDPCDRLAAHPDDPERVGPAVWAIADPAAAIAACRAVPASSRSEFQLGRALEAAGKFDEAMQAYRKAAEKGSRIAMNGIGLLHAYGRGVPKNEAEAFSWHKKAADLGLPLAEAYVGMCYRGGRGVTRDLAEGFGWIRKSAEHDCALGQFQLGRAYWFGTGVAKSESQAATWYAKAAQQGLADALVAQSEMQPSGPIDQTPASYVLRPEATVPASFAAFSGVWLGRWDMTYPTVIIVRKVYEDGSADVIYRWMEQEWDKKWSSGGFRNAEIKDGVLKSGGVSLRLDPADSSKGEGTLTLSGTMSRTSKFRRLQ